MKEQLQHYELTLILPGSIAEEQHQQVLDQIKGLLEKNTAQITNFSELGRKKLAYAIKQLRHGFYFIYEFDLMPKLLKQIENELKLNNSILRFLTIKKRVKTAEEVSKEEKIKASKVKAKIKKQEEAKEETKEKITKPKISLEDLDKKLDELLDEDII